MIQGVAEIPLKRLPDERGTVYHMLKATDGHFQRFGEIYFSSVYSGIVKGWHLHEEMTLNYACIYGRVKLVVYDERPNSPTAGIVEEFFLGPDNYSLVTIPPGLWNGFKGISPEGLSIVANCATHPHDPSRSRRLDPLNNHIPYSWDIRHG